VTSPSALPWSSADPKRLAQVVGVLTDIDDTLTTDGAIPMGVVAALAALRADGLPTIAITGRPMGWSRPIASSTPLAAVALLRDGDDVRIEFADADDVRAANAARLARVAERIVAEVPGATLARDSAGRVTDIAIDHSEFTHLDQAQIDAVVARMREAGMQATVSSIHVNGWFGTHTKLTGARWIVGRVLGRDLDAERDRWLYVGDSTNDEPMFAAFPLSVGVANLFDFADRLQRWPAYVTALDRGRGFVEIAESLLAARAVTG